MQIFKSLSIYVFCIFIIVISLFINISNVSFSKETLATPLAGRVVVLDAGHGKSDNGASGNGLHEKNVNLEIVQRMCEYFEEYSDIKVYATRLDDSYPTNFARAKMANDAADLFVSIHQNSNVTSDSNGTEVLYCVWKRRRCVLKTAYK